MSLLFGALLVPSRIAWVALGFMAQVIFTARFFIQWLASERRGSSVVPVSFWYLSLAGAALLLLYAVHRRDPVFVLGQSAGLFIYVRNLVLIRRDADGLEGRDG